MMIKSALVPTSTPSALSQNYPFLLLLRYLSALHIFVAALFPSQHWLLRSASIELSFLVFLSGFTLFHTSAPLLQSSSIVEPQTSFYLRRFALIVPFHTIVVFLHAIFFSTSSRPFTRAFFTSLFLSPYLPASFVFPPDDSPYVAPTLLPSLVLAYLIFPAIIQLLPCVNITNQLYMTYLTSCLYMLTALQAIWIANLPTKANPRAIILLDYIAYVPFSTYIPSFLFGVAIAVSRCAVPYPNATPSFSFRIIRFLSALLALVFAMVAAIPFSSRRSEVGFLSTWLVTGMLLPIFAAVTCTAASLSDFHPSRGNNSISRSGKSVTIQHISRLSFVYYVTSSLVYRFLATLFCSSSWTEISRRAICSAYISHLPLPPADELAAVSFRANAMAAFYGYRVSPVVFVPVSLIVTIVLYFAVFAPLFSALVGLVDRLTSDLRHDGPTRSRLVAYITRSFWDNAPRQKPRRDLPAVQRAFRIFVYYVAAITFGIVVFRLSVPLTSPLAEQRNSVLCFLPRFPLNCHDQTDVLTDVVVAPADIHMSTWGIFSNILKACRWISLLTLPPMICNVLGHLLFPRAVWKQLPTISHMLWTDSRKRHQSEEEGVVSSTENVDQGQMLTRDQRVSLKNSFDDMNLDFVIFVRYVTRGNNPRLVLKNVRRAISVFNESGLPNNMWQVEVVTDVGLKISEDACSLGAREIVVPPSYRSSQGAMYKARALNYAIEASTARDHDWIVHLDEETTFDTDTVRAILFHCGREAYRTYVTGKQKWPCIGQGPILYGRWLSEGLDLDDESSNQKSGNWMTTLADSGRVSDDCGRYRLQFEKGEVWVGMHGSFVVVCNAVEKAVTFDHGVEGSIAEDAFFAMVARTKGVRFSWIDALMFEQSPFTLTDFMKQRSRWLVGGLLVVTCKRIPLWARWVMGGLTIVWFCLPLTCLIVMAAVLLGEGEGWDTYFRVFIPLLTTLSLWNYVFGFFVTFSAQKLGLIRFMVMLYIQVVLAPVFGFMEIMSVCYALCNFSQLSTGFHVVQKDIPDGNGQEEQEQASYGSITADQRPPV